MKPGNPPHIFAPKPHEADKWRRQARIAAGVLRERSVEEGREFVEIGFVFNDGIIKLKIPAGIIRTMSQGELGDEIYRLVLAAATPAGST